MDIDCGTVDRAVSKSGFQGEKVKAVLITVSGVSVAERMRAEAVIHAKQLPVAKDAPVEPLLIHGIAPIRLLGKQPGFGFHMAGAGIPVIPDILADALRDGDITV